MKRQQKNQVSTTPSESSIPGAFALAAESGASTMAEAILQKVEALGGIEMLEQLLVERKQLEVQQHVNNAHAELMKAALIDPRATAAATRKLRDEFRFREQRAASPAAPVVVEGNDSNVVG